MVELYLHPPPPYVFMDAKLISRQRKTTLFTAVKNRLSPKYQVTNITVNTVNTAP
jgi:hypothetical protein